MLRGAERGAGLGVPPLEILDQLALAGEPALDVDEILLVGDQLGARVDEVALLQVGFEPVRGRHVEDAADLALQPVHLHGVARAQFVALVSNSARRAAMPASSRRSVRRRARRTSATEKASQTSPLTKTPRANIMADWIIDGSATPPSDRHYRGEARAATEARRRPSVRIRAESVKSRKV